MLSPLATRAQWGQRFHMEGAGVGWQDELRHLDEELAAGRLSAEEYRQLRDALLTSQGSQPSDSGQPEANQDSSPFPPPFKWDSDEVTTRMAPKPAPSPGGVPGSGQIGDAERTQVVSGPAAPPTAMPPGAPPHNQPVGYSVPSWQQAGDQGRHVPPWAGQDLPPIGQEPTWLRQGPEAFDTERRSSARMIVIFVAVLALLGGGAALYWFVFRGGEDQPVTASTSPPTPTSTTVPKPAGPFVELDGQIVVNDTYSMDDAARASRPARSEIKTLTESGTETIAGFVTETDDGIRTGIWTFEPRSDVEATKLLDAIDQLYHRAKYQDYAGAPAGVRALYLPAADGSNRVSYRAHYVHKGVVVRVEAYGGDDPRSVEQKFNDLLGRQLDDFPPSAS
jgi:hypothetical protein